MLPVPQTAMHQQLSMMLHVHAYLYTAFAEEVISPISVFASLLAT
jgi:hypothetical protein